MDASTQTRPMTDDERRLAELGYRQDLSRRMSGFQNFALSFTIISILSGALTLYGYGITTAALSSRRGAGRSCRSS